MKAYESAYPGSMFERPDGGYLCRDDAKSLAAGLLALIASGDRAAADAEDALKAADAEIKRLHAECEAAAAYVSAIPISAGLTPETSEQYRAYIPYLTKRTKGD